MFLSPLAKWKESTANRFVHCKKPIENDKKPTVLLGVEDRVAEERPDLNFQIF